MHTTLNGVRLSYSDDGQGLALVFVHGFPLARGTWQRQVDAFRSSHRVLAPDLRGFGDSDAPADAAPIPMSQFADDVHALLEHLGTGPVVLAGHSMGGYVALAFAHRYPEMLRGLVLVGTKAGADTADAAAARRATAEKVKAEGAGAVVDAMAPKMLAPGNRDAPMTEAVRQFMAASKPAGVIGALLGMAERPDSTPLLTQITVPTLVITGSEDVLIPPAESEKLARAIPGARLSTVPNAGHLVAFEQPEAFDRALSEWLNQAVRPPGP